MPSFRRDTTPLGKARLDYFWLNKGPWSDLDDYAAFLPGAPPRKLPGANFYPEDMAREEFESLGEDAVAEAQRRDAEGFFTVIRRDAARHLTIVPYSQEYQPDLTGAAALLHEAARLTENNRSTDSSTSAPMRSSPTITMRATWRGWIWMRPLDITIGPYETYNDELFGYKAAFEAYVNLRDDRETARCNCSPDHLQEIENNLPIEPHYRNPKLGALAPIR